MDNKEFNLRKDWDSIETVASDIWPEEWSQLNPLEIKALEPMLSRNIIKLQITDNHILSKAQSKSKSF
ncbi:hypothetical protein [Parabacteroides distasonis]|uniref:hypothetical protein n=1 Tax=Parabacteroides distasonis TaxID=823 RepID=UPI001E610BBB|nr:hypothetical protein [Parabacteroides distasonis]